MPPLLLPYLALVTGVVSLGFSAIFVRWADAPGVVTAFYRMAVAAGVVLVPWLLRIRANMRLQRPRQVMQPGARPVMILLRHHLVAAAGGLLLAIDMALWSSGVVMAGATNPTLLANTAPLWVAIGALVLFKERLGTVFWIGIAVALAGVAVILGIDRLQSEALGLGSALGLLAGVFYGAYFLVTQRGRESLDTVSYLGTVCLSSSLFLVVLTAALGKPFGGYSATTYLSFLGLGLVSQVCGYLSLNYALGYLRASLVAPTMLGQPVLTAVLAMILLGEPITLIQLAGGTAVLAGVCLVHHSRSS